MATVEVESSLAVQGKAEVEATAPATVVRSADQSPRDSSLNNASQTTPRYAPNGSSVLSKTVPVEPEAAFSSAPAASPAPASVSSVPAPLEDTSIIGPAVQATPVMVVSSEITEVSSPKATTVIESSAADAEKTVSPLPSAASAVPAKAVTATASGIAPIEEAALMISAKSIDLAAVELSSELPPAVSKTNGDVAPAISDAASSLSLKSLPKVAADAAKQAGNDYVTAGKEARTTVSKLVAAFHKPGPAITLFVDQIVTAVFLLVVAFQVLLIPVFMPSIFRLAYSLVWGLLFGLGLSFLFYYHKKRKTEINELLSVNLGLKGMHLVAGGLPSWFSVSQSEKLEWLNRLIEELWPHVDKGVCEMIKEITAQVMPGVLKSLPAGLRGVVKSIGFKHLTFGMAPFRVESMWVSAHDKESLVLELSVKWCGDPNITLAIEIPGGQKLCPRVMDITFIATIRVVLNPLVARVPCFVAVMATVPKPPLIKYRLDFGKAMGGSMAPAAVTPVVNYFIREVITKMLVWPQRLVIPVLQETEQDRVEIQKLMRRHRGVLRVCVVAAKELRAQDWGANDVMCELTTDSEYYECTSIRRARPVAADTKEEQERLGEYVMWNDYIYLLIQEPRDQMLRLEAFDIDKLRPGKLLTGQVTQIVNGRALIGRSLIKVAEVCRQGSEATGASPEPVSMMAHLGSGEWGTPGGPGKGLGKVRLSMTYWPFERFTKYDVENAMTGIVTIRLLRVWGLSAAGDSLTAFVRVTSSANRKEWKSSNRTWTRRAHVQRLQNEMKKLEMIRDRDLREGRRKEAEKKGKYLEALQDAIKGNKARARLMVDMDYTLDSSAMHAIYKVKLTDVIKIKVLEASLLASPECLGRLDIPVSDIVTANDFNPMTGQREFGLHRKRWEEWSPEQPERPIDDLERGIVLEEGDGARIWVEMRWVPCIQSMGPLAEDEEWNFKPSPSQEVVAAPPADAS